MHAGKRISRWVHLALLIVSLAVLMSACDGKASPTPVQVETATVLPDETQLVLPTPSETPLIGKVILVSPPEMVVQNTALLPELISVMASSSGLLYEQRSALNLADIVSDWKIVILPEYDPIISDALKAAPAVQFVVYSDQELGMADNLSVIRLRTEYQAFIAGYLSILITPDWRVVGLFSADDPRSSLATSAYLNGAHYYCGICNSTLSPILRFPVLERISPGIEAMPWQPVVDAMLGNIIYVIYVAPEASSGEVLTYLAQKGIVLVGGQTPPDDVRAHWAATVMLDLQSPLQAMWNDLVAGHGGKSLDTPVLVTDTNEEFFSPGRQRLVQEMLEMLIDGAVYPLDVPLQ